MKIFKYLKKSFSFKDYFSITYDEWEDFRGRRFLAIVAIYYENINLNFSVIAHKHFRTNYTSEAISNYIIHKLDKFNIRNKILFVTSDTASNVQAAARNSHFAWMPCVLHVLNHTKFK